jgi:toxin-antitoxin system PIN domain toxin
VILCDVNVYVNAAVAAAAHHAPCRAALRQAAAGRRPVGRNATIHAGVVRILTHARIFAPPLPTAQAFAFLARVDLDTRAVAVEPGRRHWGLFQDFVRYFHLAGGGVMDAWFAALAIEHEAEWWTCDGSFAKYPGLQLRNVLAESGESAESAESAEPTGGGNASRPTGR